MNAIKTTLKYAAVIAAGTFALASLLCGIAALWAGEPMGAAVCAMAIVGSGTVVDSLLR